MTRLKPELWLNKSQQLCRTCSPKPTRLWPTAGLQRQLFTWKEKSSRHSAGLTIPPWMTAVWVSLACILPRLPRVCLSRTHFIFTPLLPWLNYRLQIIHILDIPLLSYSLVLAHLHLNLDNLRGFEQSWRVLVPQITTVASREKANEKYYRKRH